MRTSSLAEHSAAAEAKREAETLWNRYSSANLKQSADLRRSLSETDENVSK